MAELKSKDIAASIPEQSKLFRYQIGDVVNMLNESHPSVSRDEEGVILEFTNDAKSYLNVAFGEDVVEVTEDEINRIA